MEVDMSNSPSRKFGKESFSYISPISTRRVNNNHIHSPKSHFLSVQRKLSFNNDNNNFEDKNNNLVQNVNTSFRNSTPNYKDIGSPPYKRMKELTFDSSTPRNGRVTPPHSDISLIASVTQSPRPSYVPTVPLDNISRLRFIAPINPFTPTGRSLISSDQKRRRERKEISNTSHRTEEKSVLGPSFHELETSRFTEEFKVDEFIASGSFGTVYKCTHFLDGVTYAIKKSSKPVAGTSYEQLSRREVFAHAALKPRTHIVTYYSSWIEMGHLYIQTEYCNGGSLEKQIENNRVYTESGLLKIVNHIAKGLKYIHLKDLAHLDIKPANILICKANYAESSDEDLFVCKEEDDYAIYKIGDLGNVTVVNEPYDVQDGDCRYMAKELLNENYTCLKKADIFSFGMTLFEVANGGPLPKNGDEWQNLRNGIIAYVSKYSAFFNNLIRYMLHPDPEKRPTVNTVLQLSRVTEPCLQREICYINDKTNRYAKKIHAAKKCLQNLTFPNSESSIIPKIVVDHL